MRTSGCLAVREGWGRRVRWQATSAILAATRMPKAELEESTCGTLATERWAERGARNGTQPAGRQLRPRDGRRARWVPQAIQSASQPRYANVSSDRGSAGGRSAGWLRRYAIDFSPSRGPSLLLIRPVPVAGFPEVSASAILPWLRRGRWRRASPNCWACRSDQGLGAAPWESRSPSRREAPGQRQALDHRSEGVPPTKMQRFSNTAGGVPDRAGTPRSGPGSKG